MAPEHRAELANQLWDILASMTLLLTAKGWKPKAIADFWGQEESQVEAILHPEPPRRFHTVTDGKSWFPVEAQPHYNASIERYLAGWQARACENAAYNAQVRGGWIELVPGPKAISQQHWRRWKHLCKRDLDVIEWETVDQAIIAGCCARYDARWAVGIDLPPVEELLLMWSKFEKELKQQKEPE